MADPVLAHDAWLSVGAPEKASSVKRLTGDLGIRSVLEIGCGSGALLAQMIQTGVGTTYAACEPSRELFLHARSRVYDVDVELRCETFEASGFDERRWDLIVLSHVLEHTQDPAALVAGVLGTARYVVIEVPLEGTRMGALRSRLRRVIGGRSRTDNAAGHIQFFSAADIHRLVQWSGGEVLRSLTYFPVGTYRHLWEAATGWRRLYYSAWPIIHGITGSRLLALVYYGHFAALVAPRSLDDASVVPYPLYWHPRKR